MRRDSSYSSGGKTEDSLGSACVGPPRDDATAHRTWDHGRRSSSSSSSLYVVTVHCTLHTVHCTLYIVHCTLYNVHCTLCNVHCALYSPMSDRMYPDTQCVRHNGQDSTLALCTVTLHSLYALTVHCHCTLSLYTVTVNLVQFFWRGWMVI